MLRGFQSAMRVNIPERSIKKKKKQRKKKKKEQPHFTLQTTGVAGVAVSHSQRFLCFQFFLFFCQIWALPGATNHPTEACAAAHCRASCGSAFEKRDSFNTVKSVLIRWMFLFHRWWRRLSMSLLPKPRRVTALAKVACCFIYWPFVCSLWKRDATLVAKVIIISMSSRLWRFQCTWRRSRLCTFQRCLSQL